MIFGTVIDIGSIFYHTKNQVGGVCAGGDMDFINWFALWSNWNYSSLAELGTYTGTGVSSQFGISKWELTGHSPFGKLWINGRFIINHYYNFTNF